MEDRLRKANSNYISLVVVLALLAACAPQRDPNYKAPEDFQGLVDQGVSPKLSDSGLNYIDNPEISRVLQDHFSTETSSSEDSTRMRNEDLYFAQRISGINLSDSVVLEGEILAGQPVAMKVAFEPMSEDSDSEIILEGVWRTSAKAQEFTAELKSSNGYTAEVTAKTNTNNASKLIVGKLREPVKSRAKDSSKNDLPPTVSFGHRIESKELVRRTANDDGGKESVWPVTEVTAQVYGGVAKSDLYEDKFAGGNSENNSQESRSGNQVVQSPSRGGESSLKPRFSRPIATIPLVAAKETGTLVEVNTDRFGQVYVAPYSQEELVPTSNDENEESPDSRLGNVTFLVGSGVGSGDDDDSDIDSDSSAGLNENDDQSQATNPSASSEESRSSQQSLENIFGTFEIIGKKKPENAKQNGSATKEPSTQTGSERQGRPSKGSHTQTGVPPKDGTPANSQPLKSDGTPSNSKSDGAPNKQSASSPSGVSQPTSAAVQPPRASSVASPPTTKSPTTAASPATSPSAVAQPPKTSNSAASPASSSGSQTTAATAGSDQRRSATNGTSRRQAPAIYVVRDRTSKDKNSCPLRMMGDLKDPVIKELWEDCADPRVRKRALDLVANDSHAKSILSHLSDGSEPSISGFAIDFSSFKNPKSRSLYQVHSALNRVYRSEMKGSACHPGLISVVARESAFQNCALALDKAGRTTDTGLWQFVDTTAKGFTNYLGKITLGSNKYVKRPLVTSPYYCPTLQDGRTNPLLSTRAACALYESNRGMPELKIMRLGSHDLFKYLQMYFALGGGTFRSAVNGSDTLRTEYERLPESERRGNQRATILISKYYGNRFYDLFEDRLLPQKIGRLDVYRRRDYVLMVNIGFWAMLDPAGFEVMVANHLREKINAARTPAEKKKLEATQAWFSKIADKLPHMDQYGNFIATDGPS